MLPQAIGFIPGRSLHPFQATHQIFAQPGLRRTLAGLFDAELERISHPGVQIVLSRELPAGPAEDPLALGGFSQPRQAVGEHQVGVGPGPRGRSRRLDDPFCYHFPQVQQPLAKDAEAVGITTTAGAQETWQIELRRQAMQIEPLQHPVAGASEEQAVSARKPGQRNPTEPGHADRQMGFIALQEL
jgi:hypothetical protein